MAGGLILGLDTCTAWMNLALMDREGRLLCERRERQATHTTTLTPAIDQLLGQGGGVWGDLSALGAVVGPGSFTGLRVGLATALGICVGRGIPTWGLGSLDALARFAPVAGEGMAVLDARRSRVYTARFRSDRVSVERLTEDADLPPDRVLCSGYPPAWAVGDGVPLVPGWPPSCSCLSQTPNLALPAARHALARLNERAPAEPLAARYVRAADAVPPPR